MIHFSQVPLSHCCYRNPVSLLIDAWSDANELQSELCSPIPLQGKLGKGHRMERHWRSTRAPNSNTSKQRTSVFLWFLYPMQKTLGYSEERSHHRKLQTAKKFPSSNIMTPWVGHPAAGPGIRFQLLGNKSGLLYTSTKGGRKQKHMPHQKQTHSRAQK